MRANRIILLKAHTHTHTYTAGKNMFSGAINKMFRHAGGQRASERERGNSADNVTTTTNLSR